MKLTNKAAMELAEKIARHSTHKHHHIGCVITNKKGHLISTGFNQYKTHPLQARFQTTEEKMNLHAEIHALSNMRGDQVPHNLYVVRVRADGSHGMAKPCKGCQGAIAAFDIKNVYWSTTDD